MKCVDYVEAGRTVSGSVWNLTWNLSAEQTYSAPTLTRHTARKYTSGQRRGAGYNQCSCMLIMLETRKVVLHLLH